MTSENSLSIERVPRSTHRYVLALLLGAVGACDAVPTAALLSAVGPGPQQPAPGPPRPEEARGDEYIYLANADASRPSRLVAGAAPAWSPDARRIAFHRGGEIGVVNGGGEIRVVNTDGTGETRLASGSHPSWSPDGRLIAFTNSGGISVMNADGSAATTIVRHDYGDDTWKPDDMGVSHAAWSPDGRRIAFFHLGDGDMRPARAFVTNVDGSGLRGLTSYDDGRRYAESDPSWSPDGSKIVFWSYGYGIAAINSDGGETTTIYSAFPAVAFGAKPVWSPDGRKIAFNWISYTRAGAFRAIWSIPAGGGQAEQFIADAYDAAWSPDGARIAFVSRRAQ